MKANCRRLVSAKCALGPAIAAWALLAGSSAGAAPATVKVFEGTARERPDASATVLRTFPEDTDLSVSEEVTDGWRRVRLPDGGVGYMRDEELKLREATSPRPPPPPRRPVSRAAPILYIKDLSHLTEVVRNDDEVHRMAVALKNRQTAAIAVSTGGMVAGALLIAGAMTTFTHQSCDVFTGGGPNGSTTTSLCHSASNQGMIYTGSGVLLASGLVAVLLWPKRDDVLDVINGWNRHHVDDPITVDRNLAVHDD